MLKQLSAEFISHGEGSAPARALASLAALVQRKANVLAYIDGFWLTFRIAILGIIFVIPITKAPPGRFTPVPFKGWSSLRRLGFLRS
jgi:DHA2 family multidrug resistance protein